MNKNLSKIILISSGVLILLSALFFFVPMEKFWQKIPFINQLSNNTSLVIETPNSQASVTINGEDYGDTPVLSTDLAPGTYEIEMNRVTETENSFYKPVSLVVELNNNTEAYVSLEIGPADTKSGYVVYYTPAPFGDGESYITISSNRSATDVTLDGQFIGETPIGLTEVNSGEHTLKFTSTGYEDLVVKVQATEGFNLNVNTYLFPVPINLAPATNEEG